MCELCASCVRVLTACPASLQDLAKFYCIRMVPMFAFFQVKERRSSMKQEIKLLLASMFFILNLQFEVTVNAFLLASFRADTAEPSFGRRCVAHQRFFLPICLNPRHSPLLV